jgi:DNA-binding MarR family transcriptional regulator
MTRHSFPGTLDDMTVKWLSPEQQRAWRRYLEVGKLLPARLGHELQASSGLTVAEYEVLVNLSEAPDGRLRPYQLGAAMQWEQSRLSHQLTRMQRRGLVTREDCAGDGRGAFVVLTEAGWSAIRSAAPAHVAAVRRFVFDRLTEEETRAFDNACAKILAALASDESGCDLELAQA